MIERSSYPRMAIVLLALVGFFDATYLMLSRFETNVAMVCPITGDGCTTVRDSVWSVFPPAHMATFGLPVALIGMFGYGLIFLLSLRALHADTLAALPLPQTLVALGSIGVVFSVYLTSLQIFVIQALCSWCALSAIVMTTIWLLALYDWRVWRSHSIATETTLGAGTARGAH
jgi:uncharacterized membrane protein